MKNRYAGELKIKFPDGIVETCWIEEKAYKGKQHFIRHVREKFFSIMQAAVDAFPEIEQGESDIKQAAEAQRKGLKMISYHGDFYQELLRCLMPPELRDTADFGGLKNGKK